MRARLLARLARRVAIAAGVAVLAYPAHAHAAEPTTIELRIEIRTDAAPALSPTVTPGSGLDPAAFVRSVSGTRIDSTTCTPTLSTVPGPTGAGIGGATIGIDHCADTGLSTSVNLANSSAEVTYGGYHSTGSARLRWIDWAVIGMAVLMIIIIIVVLSDPEP